MGDLPLLGTNAQIIRIVEALFGVQPGNTYFTNFQDFVEETSLDALSNALVVAVAPADAGSLAATVVANYQIDADLETDDGQNVVELLELFITAQLNATPEIQWGAKVLEITNLYTTLWDDELLGESVIAFNDAVVASLVYSANPENPDINDPDTGGPIDPPTEEAISLTTDQDNLVGTDADDVFEGIVFDNSNTLQSGDRLDGGAGDDTLNAEVGNSQDFAISARTTAIESIFFNARSDSRDSNDNNLQNNFVQIDAADMDGVTEWGTDGSRADVVIEDIRIQDNEITKDITFTMRDTDPGSNADGDDGDISDNNDSEEGASLHAYFDANSLRSGAVVTEGIFRIQILDMQNDLFYVVDEDTGETAPTVGLVPDSTDPTAPQPLKDDTNDGFIFKIGTTEFEIINTGLDADGNDNGTTGISGANNYDELLEAIQWGFDNSPDIQGLADFVGEYTISQGNAFTSEYKDGDVATHREALGTEIQVEFALHETSALSFIEWIPAADIIQQPSTNLATDIIIGAPSVRTTELITANAIFDNVGRGSEGGDLEVGTMSTRGGVQQIDVQVEDSSWLTNVRSTNEALEVVTVVTSEVAPDTVPATSAAVDGSSYTNGDLYIGSGLNDGDNMFDLRLAEEHVDTNGLVDVRTFDASAFEGNLKIGADLTNGSLVKYLHPIEEDLAGETVDDLAFNYDLGKGNDFLNIEIDDALVADSDFAFNADGGMGDDNIQTAIDIMSDAEYTAQVSLENLMVDGGAGNDTITTMGEGNFKIYGNTGDDAIYADNTGVGVTLAAVAAGGVEAVQSMEFTAGGVNNPGGIITVGGVAVTVGEGWTATQIGDAVEAAFENNATFATVVNAAGVVTFTWASIGRVTSLLTFDDTGTTGVTVAAGDIDAIEIGEAINGAVSEVQLITAQIPAASGDIVINGVTIAVLVGDTAQETAGKIATALNGSAGLSAVVATDSTVLNDGDDDASYTDADIIVTFSGTAPAAAIVIDDTTAGGTGATTQVAQNATGTADDNEVVAIPADGGTNEIQTLTITAVTPGDAAATTSFTVDGVTVTVPIGANLSIADTATLIETTFAGNSTFASVVATATTVIFTYEAVGDMDLIEVIDVDSGVLSTIVETTPGADAAPAVGLPTINLANTITSPIEGITGPANNAIWTANNLKLANGDDDNQLITQDTVEVSTFTGIKGQLQVSFKGLDSEIIDIAYDRGTNSTSAYAIRTALKNAVANDEVLNKLLVVKDGPEATFIIESLIDGEMALSDLDIDFLAPLTADDAAVAGRTQMTDSEENDADISAFSDATAESAYDEAFAQSNTAVDLNGANSILAQGSDNTIDGGAGDDVIVLGTSDENAVTNATASSNDTVEFNDDFGTDTIVNFVLATARNEDGVSLLGDDTLDFTSYLSADEATTYDASGSLTVSDSEIILNSDSTINEYVTADNTAVNGLILVVHADDANVADVYTATSTSSSTEVATEIVGTIDMADVAIASFTLADFA